MLGFHPISTQPISALEVAVAAFDATLMAAIRQQWPQTTFSQPQAVASGMTPPNFLPT